MFTTVLDEKAQQEQGTDENGGRGKDCDSPGLFIPREHEYASAK